MAGVISDIRMPGMSKIRMLRMLRAVRSDVSVLFVIGNADATWIDEIRAYTASITKPFLSSQSIVKLEQVLSDTDLHTPPRRA